MPTDSIASYNAKLPPNQTEIVARLRTEIEAALSDAVAKVWHGHPVWFDGENPVVGYDARKNSVNILFWNGQALGEPELVAVGKYRAAGKSFRESSEVDSVALRRWLEKARTNVFDGVTHFRKLREEAKRSATASPAPVGTAEAKSAKRTSSPRTSSNKAAPRGTAKKR